MTNTKQCCEKCSGDFDSKGCTMQLACPCHKREDWRESFERESPLAFDGREWAKSFIESELADAVANERKEIVEIVEEAEKQIRLVDKTPKYEYSKNERDANNAGEHPTEIGQRWAMPWEIARTLSKRIKARGEITK